MFKQYVKARNIPPMVIEHAIANGTPAIGTGAHIGTVEYCTEDVKVVINAITGDVITVHRI
jgi:hypothetical protein